MSTRTRAIKAESTSSSASISTTAGVITSSSASNAVAIVSRVEMPSTTAGLTAKPVHVLKGYALDLGIPVTGLIKYDLVEALMKRLLELGAAEESSQAAPSTTDLALLAEDDRPALEGLQVMVLKCMLVERELPNHGKKAQLIDRLIYGMKGAPPAGAEVAPSDIIFVGDAIIGIDGQFTIPSPASAADYESLVRVLSDPSKRPVSLNVQKPGASSEPVRTLTFGPGKLGVTVGLTERCTDQQLCRRIFSGGC